MSKEGSSVPDGSKLQQQTDADNTANVKDKKTDKDKPQPKKKKKKNLWALKACIITLFLSLAVNAASELALEGAHIAIAIVITLIIIIIGVIFDIIGTFPSNVIEKGQGK